MATNGSSFFISYFNWLGVIFNSVNYKAIKHDKEQRARYRKRHAKDLDTNDPTKAGYLSYYVLWGDSTSVKTNISHYKNKFNL